jgi:tocopherol O-methyltransferase
MQQDVSAYYTQTQNHYQRWWNLDRGMSLHYGLWYPETRTLFEALKNTNKFMAELAGIVEGEHVLDAGCGVGGAAVFLAGTFAARVTGISLSELQVETARKNVIKHKVNKLTEFHVADFVDTNFNDASFDVIWACESSSHGPDKKRMLKEWHRLLKPGGRLVILDFFKQPHLSPENENLVQKWCDLWAMSPLVTADQQSSFLSSHGFTIDHQEDLTSYIVPTIKWMYRSYLIGSLPSMLYNIVFGARKYSRNHYKSGLYQYRAYKRSCWGYYAFLAQKK